MLDNNKNLQYLPSIRARLFEITNCKNKVSMIHVLQINCQLFGCWQVSIVFCRFQLFTFLKVLCKATANEQ